MEISFKKVCLEKGLAIWQRLRFVFCRCDLCLQPTTHHTLLCKVCLDDLPRFQLALCQHDLLNYPKVVESLPNLVIDHLVCIAPYEWPYSMWISQLKYQHRFEISGLLALLLANQMATLPVSFQSTMLIPVPLHARRLKARQYNQASLIAHKLAKLLEMELKEDVIFRSQYTQQQVGLSGASRRKNLKGAFTINNNVALPEHVVILDDVITTGATVSEMSKLLKRHGVKEVTVICLCLALA